MRVPVRPSWHRLRISHPRNTRSYSSTKISDPLRILFCGSDEFSSASLRALHDEHIQRPDAIAGIDVVCRPGKRTGRGLKTIREVPLKSVASSLSLPIHEIDTFTGWQPPHPINLIVAVSFGLFVPPRILKAAKYGGLNIHPSLLPDFRGPAPLHHTLLSQRRHTGITLQTLDPHRFDHGRILAQTPYPGFPIPNPDTCTVPELLDLVAPKGAELLIRGLRANVHVPPLQDVGWHPDSTQHDDLQHAPKITPEDKHLSWSAWTAAQILLRERVLGAGLWCLVADPDAPRDSEATRRVIMQGFKPFSAADRALSNLKAGHFHLLDREAAEGKVLVVRTCDGKILSIDTLTVAGRPRLPAADAAVKYHLT